MRRLVTHLLLLEVLVLLCVPQGAFAQRDARSALDELDPDVSDVNSTRDGEAEAEAEADLPPLPPPPPRRTAPEPQTQPARPQPKPPSEKGAPDLAAPPVAATGTSPAAATARQAPRPVKVTTRGERDLQAAWAAWRKANASLDPKGSKAALGELVALKEELSIEGLESFSVALGRAAQKRLEAGDDVAAIELALAARDLSPKLPYANFTVASTYFRSDAADVGRWGGALWDTTVAFWNDPRYLRPAAADLVAALLAALLATAIAVVVILFARRARYFLHDFHHLFPRGAARWQTAPLALLLLSLPLVFRMGFIPVLLALFLAVSLYLQWKERIVGAVAIALVGLVPLLGKVTTGWTTFSGTRAEALYLVELGGPDALPARAELEARAQKGLAGYPELFALGRYELRRGKLEEATAWFKKAALDRGEDPRLLVNLGNARFGLNDLEGAATHYTRAAELDPTLAAAFHNRSQVHYRKAQVMDDAARALELEKAQTAAALAQKHDPELANRPPPAEDASLDALVVGAALPWSELDALAAAESTAGRVGDQLAFRMIGMTAGPLAYLLPALLALIVAGVGALRWTVVASTGCTRCGLPVCTRCDKDLNLVAGVCSQCVTVFNRKNAVGPQVKVRKQLEVDRYQRQTARASWLAGLVCSGAGHLLTGSPIRGALFAFAFSAAVSVAILRDGVVRVPWGELPIGFRLVPAGLALVTVYLLSIRSLRKAQEE